MANHGGPTSSDREPFVQARPDRVDVKSVEANGCAGAPQAPVEGAPYRRQNRLRRFKSRLVDLSLRNRMLSCGVQSKAIPITSESASAIASVIIAGRTLALKALPNEPVPVDGSPGVSVLYTSLDDQALIRSGTGLWRDSRLFEQETAGGNLYLACGALNWVHPDTPEVQRVAPLLLIPVRLERASITGPFSIRSTGEEPAVNPSLLKKLEMEFGIRIEVPSPTYSGALDQLLDTVRDAIVHLDDWDVRADCWIGIFTFSKYLIWHDLDQNEAALMNGPVFRHVVEDPDGPFLLNPRPPKPAEVEELRRPGSLFCPLDADSSQLAAVIAAEEGSSFVLQGPPGTGKSQTIANIIGNCIAKGLTVLFVAEKQAALDVVWSRLADVGLTSFCLEIHSQKTSKLEVVKRLSEVLENADHPATSPLAMPHCASREWETQAARLRGARDRLARYADAMHRPRPVGQSLCQVLDRLCGLRDVPRVALDIPNASEIDDGRLQSMQSAIGAFKAAAAAVEPIEEHPWRGAGLSRWSPETARRIEELCDVALASLHDLREAMSAISLNLDLDLAVNAADKARLLARIAAHLAACKGIPGTLIVGRDQEAPHKSLSALVETGLRRSLIVERLAESWRPELLGLDLEWLSDRFNRWGGSSSFFAGLMLRGPRSMLRRLSLEEGVPDNETIRYHLEMALESEQLGRALLEADAELSLAFGHLWRGDATDWNALQDSLDWAATYRDLRDHLLDDHLDGASPGQVAILLDELAREPAHTRAHNPPLRTALEALAGAFEGYEGAREELSLILDLNMDEAAIGGAMIADEHLEQLVRTLEVWRGSSGRSRDWSAYVRVCAGMEEEGLAPLVAAYAARELSAKDLERVFQRSFYEQCLDEIAARETPLQGFLGLEHERLVGEFRDADQCVTSLAAKMAEGRLMSQLPINHEDADEGIQAQVSLVRREARKKRRHLSVRRLLERIPNLLPRLAPCVLASPLSVAKYIPPSMRFDIVVFDEASQIPVWDALPALGRARSAIVVGDSKQLPPTTFFEADNEEGMCRDEDDEELESILDEAIAVGLPTVMLGWHYRSRHESLISFSNSRFYEGKLTTFPCAQSRAEHLGIDLRPVPNGRYDRGASRHNVVEARAVVDELIARLRGAREESRSLGIVTLNRPQQVLIENLIDEARRQNPELEGLFEDACDEPVFVKNLENVQGDERDVILLSLCYGPDQSGHLSLNFGPLNRAGGERRFNVAITRAREQLVLFSSMQPQDIDLSRTDAVGPTLLKEFLELAGKPVERQRTGAHSHGLGGESLSGLHSMQHEIARAIEEAGWSVQINVGSSIHPVHIAVEHSDHPGYYLLGILCEANGPVPGSIRDEERLREEQLASRGWRVHRIRALDWWHNPKGELARVLAVLEGAGEHQADGGICSTDTAHSAISSESGNSSSNHL